MNQQEFHCYDQMCHKAANLISARIILKADSVLGFATGSTPLGIYKILVDWYNQSDLDFDGVRTINLDEYCGIPFGHPQSYHYFMQTHLFSKINILRKILTCPTAWPKILRRNANTTIR